jgi:transposase-like protein
MTIIIPGGLELQIRTAGKDHGDARREALGMNISPFEAETFWTAFLRKLARRGLRGVNLVVSDFMRASKPP